ncbi:hypothetical protein MMC07_001388 [Pseudocyphellaria aurata]|nr:hypothetical protein [Pseudocyphellaria aurata]
MEQPQFQQGPMASGPPPTQGMQPGPPGPPPPPQAVAAPPPPAGPPPPTAPAKDERDKVDKGMSSAILAGPLLIASFFLPPTLSIQLLIRPFPLALEDAQQKYGGKYFKDPKKNRAMNEKITDFLRKFFEKKTGYASPPRRFSLQLLAVVPPSPLKMGLAIADLPPAA